MNTACVRPGTMLVDTIKQFNSDITVTNLDGTGKPANGRSLMKVVALGVKEDRLRFTAQGADAEQALKAIGNAIAAGLWGGRIMSRRVVTITLNPAYDLVGFCRKLNAHEPGENHRSACGG